MCMCMPICLLLPYVEIASGALLLCAPALLVTADSYAVVPGSALAALSLSFPCVPARLVHLGRVACACVPAVSVLQCPLCPPWRCTVTIFGRPLYLQRSSLLPPLAGWLRFERLVP